MIGLVMAAFSLSGVARAATLSILPTTAGDDDFGPIQIGQIHTHTFTVSWSIDSGTESLDSVSVALFGDPAFTFAAGGTTFTPAVANSASFGLDVEFAPTSPGTVFTDLVLFLNGNFVSEEGQTTQVSTGIPLTGEGIEASAVPLPAALPLFGTGLGLIGFIGWRRRRASKA